MAGSHPARLSRQCKRYSKDAFQRTKARYLAMWLNEHIDQGKMTIDRLGSWERWLRKQAAHLSREGVNIERFFDVDPKKIGTPRPGLTRVCDRGHSCSLGMIFLLVLAGARSAREKITRFLEGKEYSPGKDYLFHRLKFGKNTGFQLAIELVRSTILNELQPTNNLTLR